MNNVTFFFAGMASQALGRQVALLANRPLGNWHLQRFSDGEIRPSLKENLQGATVIIIQSTYPPAEHMLELLLMVDAAKNAGAHKIIVVAPYLGYLRQDKIHELGEAHGAALTCNLLLAAGTDHLIVCHPHAKNLKNFFNRPISQVCSHAIFIPYIENLRSENMCFVAPDEGGLEEAKWYAQYFNTNLIVCDKIRPKSNVVKLIQIIGRIEHTDAIIIDDIVDTGNTLIAVTDQLRSQGARTVRALCTHPILSGDAYERLASSGLEEIVVTNTIPLKQITEKIEVLDIASLIVEAINN